ncbi:mutator type transposase [Tanacetum coccineum]
MYCSFLKPDMSLDNGLYALGNDKDVRRIVEYIRLCYKMIEVFIEHDMTTVYTYIDAAYNTQTKNSRHEDGESIQPNTTTLTTPTEFANDFYSAFNPFLEEDDFDPFFGLDSEPVDSTTAKNECVDKGKGVVLDDDQVYVATDNTMENETEDENNDGDSSKSSERDKIVDVDNELVDVAVDMDHFDRANAKTMGNEGTPEFNADEEFDMGMDVIDTEEFESASDEDRINKIRSRKIKQLNKQSQLKEGGLHKLRDYVLELQQSNPNTTVRIGVESKADHMKTTRIFKRIYVCLGEAKEGFKACMWQFLGFDGTFMKGQFPGKMLTVVGVEPNNGIYPLAYGIVETESKESWTWFLQHLKEDLDLQDHSNFTFISNRRKGIIPAVAEIFPAAEHRYCLRHILENRKLRIVLVKQVIKRSDGPLTPTATRLLNVVKTEASECIAHFNGENRKSQDCHVHPYYRLETWRQVYSHHINPIKGKIMWPKSPIPTTILPLNHHPQVGRLPKNRKKSAGQDIQMVNNGKLSRKLKTVTCVLCNSKGHNKRSCIGPRKDAGNKGSISNAGKKRPRSETTTRTSQAAKKPKNAHIGVQTRSQASNKGNQPTAAAKKPINKGKKIV